MAGVLVRRLAVGAGLVVLFAVWSVFFFLLYVFGSAFLMGKNLITPDLGWPLAGITFLVCLGTYSAVAGKLLNRLSP